MGAVKSEPEGVLASEVERKEARRINRSEEQVFSGRLEGGCGTVDALG